MLFENEEILAHFRARVQAEQLLLFPTCPRLQALGAQLNILHRWGIAKLVLSLLWAGQWRGYVISFHIHALVKPGGVPPITMEKIR